MFGRRKADVSPVSIIIKSTVLLPIFCCIELNSICLDCSFYPCSCACVVLWWRVVWNGVGCKFIDAFFSWLVTFCKREILSLKTLSCLVLQRILVQDVQHVNLLMSLLKRISHRVASVIFHQLLFIENFNGVIARRL